MTVIRTSGYSHPLDIGFTTKTKMLKGREMIILSEG